MRRTPALLAAAIAATVLLQTPCLGQDAHSYAVAGPDPARIGTSQTSALSPGPSLYWSRMHQTPYDATEAEQRAAAISEQAMQANQRRYCNVIFLAAAIYGPGNSPAGTDNPFVNPCQQ